jgi:hypothetical protein
LTARDFTAGCTGKKRFIAFSHARRAATRAEQPSAATSTTARTWRHTTAGIAGASTSVSRRGMAARTSAGSSARRSTMPPLELVHVVPLDDLREHECSSACWCQPIEYDEEPGIWVHNALDGRENYEEGRLQPH